MNLKDDWKITCADNISLKIFSNIDNPDELVVRDNNDTGALCSFIISDDSIEIQEMSWAISLNIDWKRKLIYLSESPEKAND